MSALFSHAVRWEFCGHNPISSGIPVGSGGEEPVRECVSVPSAQPSPLKLTAEQVALVLTPARVPRSASRVPDAGLGTRRGELGALRWMDCDFDNRAFDIQHSYYWRGRHLIDTKLEASAQKLPMHPGLRDWSCRSQSSTTSPKISSFLRRVAKGRKPTRFGRCAEKKDSWCSRGLASQGRSAGIRWGIDVSGDGEHQLTIRDYLAAQQPPRHEQVPAGDVEDQASGTRQVGRCLLACGLVAQTEPNPIGDVCSRSPVETCVIVP